MAGISSILAELDRMKRMGMNRGRDMVTNTGDYFSQLTDNMRNMQMGREAVASGGNLGYQDIPKEEQYRRMTEGSLDTISGPMGAIGHTVWHGSPHRFNKFDLSKIGTGEGAQAFGRGMYVAESPSVAKSYKNAGIGNIDWENAKYGGRKIQSLYDAAQAKQALGHRTKNQKMTDDANAELYYWESLLTGTHPNIAKSNALDPNSGWPTLQKFVSGIDEKKFKNIDFPDTSLYKVDIPDEALPKMLDWDKALHEQSPDVQAALRKVGVDPTPLPSGPDAIEAAKAKYRETGSPDDYKIMHRLMNQGRNLFGSDLLKGETLLGRTDNAGRVLGREDVLRNAGIPGIKYLDANSRDAGGTSNMVMFNPDMMRILERNGEPTGLEPWKAGEWQGGFANPSLLGGMALGGGGLMAYDQMQDDESETPMARMTRYLRERQAASQ